MATPAKQQILDTAEELFYRNGITATGINRIVDEAGVAKQSLYNHFPSKKQLVVEVLKRRKEEEWLKEYIEKHADTPLGKLRAVFSCLDEWYHSDDFRGCAFIKASAEVPDPEDPIRRVAASHKQTYVDLFESLAGEAGGSKPRELANQLYLLVEGATVAAHVSNKKDAGKGAERTAELLFKKYGLVDESPG